MIESIWGIDKRGKEKRVGVELTFCWFADTYSIRMIKSEEGLYVYDMED